MSFLLLIGPLGPFEILIILFVGLLIFGSRLPEVGRSLGKGLMEFKRGLRGLQDEMDDIDREADRSIDDELARRALPTNPAEEHAGYGDEDLEHYDPSHMAEGDEEYYEDDPHKEPGPEFGGDPQPDADPVEEVASQGDAPDEVAGEAAEADEDQDQAAPAPPTTSAASDTGTIVYADLDYLGDDDDERRD